MQTTHDASGVCKLKFELQLAECSGLALSRQHPKQSPVPRMAQTKDGLLPLPAVGNRINKFQIIMELGTTALDSLEWRPASTHTHTNGGKFKYSNATERHSRLPKNISNSNQLVSRHSHRNQRWPAKAFQREWEQKPETNLERRKANRIRFIVRASQRQKAISI